MGETASNGTLPAVEAQRQSISADEIALYDRQIRLWGVQAQENIRKANVLLICIKALANEVAKNLVLAGINSLTIIDHEAVSENDLCAQFLVSEADIGKNRAEVAATQMRKLNPRVTVKVDTSDIRTKEPSFLESFNLIIATDLDFPTISTLNAASRIANSRPFYAAGVHGLYGYIFADLIEHEYVVERQMSNVPTKIGPETATRSIIATRSKKENGQTLEIVTKRELYSPLVLANTSPLPASIRNLRRRLRKVTPLLPCLRALWGFEKKYSRLPNRSRDDLVAFTRMATESNRELQLPPETLRADFLRSFLQNLGSELAPVTAMLGGLLAQDAINVIGKRQQPIQNLCLFDGDDYSVPVYPLYSSFDDDEDAVVEAGPNGVNGLGSNGNVASLPVQTTTTTTTTMTMTLTTAPQRVDGAPQNGAIEIDD